MPRSTRPCPSRSCQGHGAHLESTMALRPARTCPCSELTDTDAMDSVNKTHSEEVEAGPTVTSTCSGMRPISSEKSDRK